MIKLYFVGSLLVFVFTLRKTVYRYVERISTDEYIFSPSVGFYTFLVPSEKFNFVDVDMHDLIFCLFFLTGELGSLNNVYKASLVSMMAGSDFVKTSTGKESVNATFPVALVMVRAVRDYYQVIHV